MTPGTAERCPAFGSAGRPDSAVTTGTAAIVFTATGASSATRRTITAATAAATALLGAVVGMAGAVVAVLAWGHGSLSNILNDVLLTDVLILLIGLPLVAAVGGWLLAGREPTVISRQPLG